MYRISTNHGLLEFSARNFGERHPTVAIRDSPAANTVRTFSYENSAKTMHICAPKCKAATAFRTSLNNTVHIPVSVSRIRVFDHSSKEDATLPNGTWRERESKEGVGGSSFCGSAFELKQSAYYYQSPRLPTKSEVCPPIWYGG